MATNINIILDWFKTGKKPTQAQFWATWQSFWHKDDPIPQSAVQNLTTVLAGKAERAQLELHNNDLEAHNLEDRLGKKANSTHEHTQSDINGLVNRLQLIDTAIGNNVTNIEIVATGLTELEKNKQISKTTNFTLDNTMHKATIFCEASGTINVSIPNGLRADFICLLYNIGSGNVLPVLAGSGQTLVTNDGAIILEHNRHGIIEQLMGQNKFIVRGEYS